MTTCDLRAWTVPTLATAAARVIELARTTDPATPAVGLGRWRARDIVAHLGGVHRWATRVVRDRSADGPGPTRSPLTGDALADWFEEGAHALVAVLRDTDPEERCPNFNPGSRSVAGFWHRRQAHETTIHRWDLERCTGTTTPIAPAIAADGIEEFLVVFVRSRGKQTLTAPVGIAPTDATGAWTLTPASRPGRVDIAAGCDPACAARITGPAASLLLHLWRRIPLDAAGLEVHGDHAVAASLRSGSGCLDRAAR